MIAIHILNVGHGDSIVIEYRAKADDKPICAVIDSNLKNISEQPKALLKLEELGVESLSFVALTHPHKDHYSGLATIIDRYKNRINTIYTYPLDKAHDRLKKLLLRYRASASTDSNEISHNALEFVRTIMAIVAASQAGTDWRTPLGDYSQIAAVGMAPDVEIFTLLPHAKVKGSYYTSIDNGSLEPERRADNELSLAFLIKYKGHKIILGGDASRSGWLEHSKYLQDIMSTHDSSASKLPHHGSRIDCDSHVLDTIYTTVGSEEKLKIALISANGQTHPNHSVLDDLVSRGIKPYCTNLAKRCGANIQEMQLSSNTDPHLMRYVNSVAVNNTVQSCQGDICLIIDDQGKLSVTTQYNHPCHLRGDFSFLRQ